MAENEYKKDDWYIEIQERKRNEKKLKRRAMLDSLRASIKSLAFLR